MAGLFMSLDDVVEALARPLSQRRDGRVGRVIHAAADTLLLGRVTYESFTAVSSHQTGELAEQINGIPLALAALSAHPYGETDVQEVDRAARTAALWA
ncbi:hypothetical protein ACQP25_16675 [Microtetraspora malaysiensis]|uniref:hypothetical protein n=1 Tax=Microtetraspora malaysiensis TaxID=161358 RepID=UPI003D9461A7